MYAIFLEEMKYQRICEILKEEKVVHTLFQEVREVRKHMETL